jgi:excisionase family DNA binding protein
VKPWENSPMSNTKTNTDGLVQEYLTKEELAKRLKATKRSVDNYVAKGIIPKIKIGGLSRFNWLHVCDALENQEGGK